MFQEDVCRHAAYGEHEIFDSYQDKNTDFSLQKKAGTSTSSSPHKGKNMDMQNNIRGIILTIAKLIMFFLSMENLHARMEERVDVPIEVCVTMKFQNVGRG